MAEAGDEVRVTRNEGEERFEAPVAGDLAILTYGIEGEKLYLLHTEVPPAAEGQGVGGKLVSAALEFARGSQMKVVPFCPFARAYLARHKEYADLLASTEA